MTRTVLNLLLILLLCLVACEGASGEEWEEDDFDEPSGESFDDESNEFDDDERFEDEDEVEESDHVVFAPTVSAMADASACKLADRDSEIEIGVGFPRSSVAAPSTGIVTVKLLFVDFDDAPATVSPSEIMETFVDSAEILHTMSYGRLTVEFDPIDRWFRLGENSRDYFRTTDDLDVNAKRDIMAEAVEAADDIVDFSEVDVVYVFASDTVNHGESYHTYSEDVSADGGLIQQFAVSSEAYFDSAMVETVVHELGHAFGLTDLYDLYADDDIHKFVGDFDIMGNISGRAPGMMAYHRWMLDWIDDDQIYCQQIENATVHVSPIEQADGMKAVVVPISDQQAIVVESRRALGLDANILKEGALVYLVNADRENAEAGIIVYPDRGDEQKNEAPLSVGESVTVEGVTVEVVEAGDDGDVVNVTR